MNKKLVKGKRPSVHVRHVRTRSGVKRKVINPGIRKKKVKKRMNYAGDLIKSDDSKNNFDKYGTALKLEFFARSRNLPWNQYDDEHLDYLKKQREVIKGEMENFEGRDYVNFQEKLGALDWAIDSMNARRNKKNHEKK